MRCYCLNYAAKTISYIAVISQNLVNGSACQQEFRLLAAECRSYFYFNVSYSFWKIRYFPIRNKKRHSVMAYLVLQNFLNALILYSKKKSIYWREV